MTCGAVCSFTRVIVIAVDWIAHALEATAPSVAMT
jgi:hypothetical protein